MEYSSVPKAVGGKYIAKAERRARPTSLNNAILSALGSLRESSLFVSCKYLCKITFLFAARVQQEFSELRQSCEVTAYK